MSQVTLEQVCKTFGQTTIIRDFSLTVQDGEFLVLVGPSGCGKSTVLRLIAGLEALSGGEISIADKPMDGVSPKDRDIAMVFQNYALYPHMNVYDNMAFGLKMRRYPKIEIQRRVQHAAEILGLEALLKRKPKELSGGQRQRVALGRAIVRDPKVFLLDEPLSNLDAKLRVSMRREITQLHQRLRATTIYVTHDQVEAMTMGDRLVVLKDGDIQQIDTPMTVYTQPNNLFVAGFMGQMNLFEGVLRSGALVLPQGVSLPLPQAFLENAALLSYEGKPLILGVRPEHVVLASLSDSALLGTFSVTPERVELLGGEQWVYFSVAGQPVVAKWPSDESIQTQKPLEIGFVSGQVHWFDPETTCRIKAMAKTVASPSS